jgi:hypothetical protein
VKLPAPRVIAIDDNPLHLRGLADGLNSYGAACLQILFTGEVSAIRSCPHVRVIFADLHLNESGASEEHEKHFSLIGGLIEETITPAGPYLLVLWTRYPDQADKLAAFLETRLANVKKPIAVKALDKLAHLDSEGKVKDIKGLVAAIVAVVEEQPQVAALINWEERILDAAAGTVSEIVTLAATDDPTKRKEELARILYRLAVEAVGQSHVKKDHFRAVNEALLPILYDRVACLPSVGEDKALWEKAFSDSSGGPALSLKEAAQLNRFLHIANSDPAMTSADRGSVTPLPADYRDNFGGRFAITSAELAKSQLACAGYVDNSADFKWMFVQVEAACDYAQRYRRPGPIAFALALEAPHFEPPKKTRPDALWISPAFNLDGRERCLVANSRFVFSFTEEQVSHFKVEYRIREQLLSSLIHHIHTHGSRPGFISFHPA